MRKIITTLAIIGAILATTAVARCGADDWTPDRIAKLPQDRVEQIKQKCGQEYPDAQARQPRGSDSDLRRKRDRLLKTVCEDAEFDMLEQLIQRTGGHQSAKSQ